MQIKSCAICIQNDEHDKNITFNEDGVCNYCLDVMPKYEEVKKNYKKLPKVINKIKKAGKGKKYDCIIGMSGGVDSSYVAHLCKIYELKPLVVHFDNGWNSELAVDNVFKIINKNNFELFTLVVDWEEFKDLQRSFILSDVVDIEVPTDHAITASLVKLSKKHKIKYMISGANIATESGMPPDWSWRKADLINIKDIQKKFGKEKLRTFPTYSSFQLFWDRLFGFSQERIDILDFLEYKKTDAIEVLKKEYDWREYGGKHYESFFTKFYQAHILPTKFNIDKRRSHLSSMVRNGEISKADALIEIEQPLYDQNELDKDKEYFCKKLDFDEDEFDKILSRNPKSHLFYKSDQYYFDVLRSIIIFLKRMKLPLNMLYKKLGIRV
jgi:N-acetyl sugar amidotransferase